MLSKNRKALSIHREQRVISLRFFNFGREEEGKLVAFSSKNCDCSDGKLRTGIGLKAYYGDDGVEGKTSFSNYVREIFFLRNYYSNLETYKKVLYYV